VVVASDDETPSFFQSVEWMDGSLGMAEDHSALLLVRLVAVRPNCGVQMPEWGHDRNKGSSLSTAERVCLSVSLSFQDGERERE